MQAAQQMKANAGYQSKGAPFRRRFESLIIFLQDCIATTAEHAVRFAAAGVSVRKARAVDALRQKNSKRVEQHSEDTGKARKGKTWSHIDQTTVADYLPRRDTSVGPGLFLPCASRLLACPPLTHEHQYNRNILQTYLI